ncbi:hypothetical protein HDA44_006970 [Kribbella solani]|uniref:Uncharacterized protein n=1 Tax=Kribbella solani TaxID=236067 RepID=A0A841DZN1_9ACTN|nr:hypothetical protein [Kribbella solani]
MKLCLVNEDERRVWVAALGHAYVRSIAAGCGG